MKEPETFLFADDGAIPNAQVPLLVYRGALPADVAAIERVLAANRWPPAWRDSVHPWHHFHANTHEALGVARGQATVLFGGPGGQEITVAAGDLVVVPAGVGHKAQAASGDLLIVGAYPDNAPRPDQHRPGHHPPDRRGRDPQAHDALVAKIAAVPPPAADPLAGPGGPLHRLWGIV